MKIVIGIFALLSLISCSGNLELIKNNNPEKYSLARDILWASPGGFDLTMDIYTPNSRKESYPVLVMFHGGGWLINDKSIMDQSAAYLATNSDYVICNVNYRLLSDNDNTVTLDQIVDDAFGAVLWVKDNIAQYKGDKMRIAVTGDSAGAHLAAMIVNSGTRVSSAPFSITSPRFRPSYIPSASSVEDISEENDLTVQAAILSYGAFDIHQSAIDGFESMMNPFWWVSGSFGRGVFGDAFNVVDHPVLYMAVSPLHNIPDTSERSLPTQLFIVGSEDPLVTPSSVKAYINELQSAGHPSEYWEYEGKSHAFLDSGSNALIGSNFESDAPPALDVMIGFLDDVFVTHSSHGPR
jgi:acetyl esterase